MNATQQQWRYTADINIPPPNKVRFARPEDFTAEEIKDSCRRKMELFDSLPMAIRERIAESGMPVPVTLVAKLLHDGRSVSQVVSWIDGFTEELSLRLRLLGYHP